MGIAAKASRKAAELKETLIARTSRKRAGLSPTGVGGEAA